mgnify:CR=1 FL=1
MAKKDASISTVIADTFMTTFKYFVAFIILNNLVWTIFYFDQPKCVPGGNRVEITQNGNRDIHQEIKN